MCVVIDSAIWFSLADCGLETRVLGLGDRICTVSVVVDELISRPDGKALVSGGLTVLELDGAQVAQATRWRGQDCRLSAADSLALALAHAKGWRLATRDTALEAMASRVGVTTLGLIEVVAMMADAGLLDAEDVRRFKKALYDMGKPYDKAAVAAIEKTVKDRQRR